jgi:lysozyme
MMIPSPECYALIKHAEGFRLHPYSCPAGYDTIGYGHVIRKGESFASGISTMQAEALLREDVQSAAEAVNRLLPVRLSQGQYDALVSFTFNLGAGALQRSSLRQLLLRGEVTRAASEFRRWIYAGGRKLQGLLLRREAERRLFMSA